jgi:hypothetical protein
MATTTRKPQTPEPSYTTPVRNTPIPRNGQSQQPGQRRAGQPSHDQIAKRAYEISISGSGGSELDNWLRAERELRGE